MEMVIKIFFIYSAIDALVVVLKNNIKIYIKINIQIAPTLGSALINALPDDGVTITPKHVGAVFFDVLLAVHLSIFISVFNQLDAQNLFHSRFYFMPLHVSSICAHHQEVKIALHSLWYHHTYRCDDTRGCIIQF